MNKTQSILCALLFLFAPIAAAHQQPRPSQQFANFGDFKLRSGSVIHDFRIGYRTIGKLNSDKSNAVLWPSWLGGTSQDLLEYVGPAKVLDPTKYYVILVDAIGNGVTSSPSNSKSQPRMTFPKFTIRDMVEAEHRLLTSSFHISHLHAVMGVSMGGMQTFCWAMTYPDFMDLAIPIAGSPQSTSYDKLLWTAEIDAIESDPAWNQGNPSKPLTSGIALAEEIDQMNRTSPTYRVSRTSPHGFDTFLIQLRSEAKATGGVASDQIRQREAIISLDLPKELDLSLAASAKQIHAKLLVVVSPEDHMVNPTPALAVAAELHAPVITLDSSCGHLSLSCLSVGPTVAQFLLSPSSVHARTLRD